MLTGIQTPQIFPGRSRRFGASSGIDSCEKVLAGAELAPRLA
jgi:hypothetical protein